jgi:hypothetical protein
MSFQFGTNWPGFMGARGQHRGPAAAYEILTAFFLEATFLGIMLFGFRRVPGWLHTLATFLVAFGTTMSAFWILVPEQLDAHAGRLRDARTGWRTRRTGGPSSSPPPCPTA